MIDPSKLLANIPDSLRDPLIEEYRGICSAYSEGRWKLASLDAGRFCEVAYTIIHGAVSGTFAAAPQKPRNFLAACQAMENMVPVPVGDRSLRILIPRLLPALYEVRNNRNVGHVGGDVVANKMDSSFVREAAAWVVAELVRITHGVSTSDAQDAVDALVERANPLVWEVDGIKRVLSAGVKISDEVLLLLYSTPGWTKTSDLKVWAHNNANINRVLAGLFGKRLIEVRTDKAMITPLGVKFVETKLLKSS
ncbi:hypothetical protein [Dyella nitratireducens]|uniref:Abortive infection protein-like C-terminal domain-containing protein n=1 Tax=Dyella nitratireducens TaxID=1849580 RepID=A0ABQ1GIS5_9GAMM|nr:hypothetical protein [Dyella nitratireducens]GGA44623.1 hypothetical protein GCM10010981_37250 [Dyella nitratireducens]GLQ41718.1 hypothetical protein GCM10007902_15680 [Dyella nitratireducens]